MPSKPLSITVGSDGACSIEWNDMVASTICNIAAWVVYGMRIKDCLGAAQKVLDFLKSIHIDGISHDDFARAISYSNAADIFLHAQLNGVKFSCRTKTTKSFTLVAESKCRRPSVKAVLVDSAPPIAVIHDGAAGGAGAGASDAPAPAPVIRCTAYNYPPERIAMAEKIGITLLKCMCGCNKISWGALPGCR